jgi:tetratricopeptide (TPR) repeat protein
VERGKGKQAVEVLRSNFDKGDDDLQSVFTMGEACLLAGYVDQGEKLLDHAEELNADFRVGEIHLVRGRQRLARGDFAGAKKALEALVKARRGTITGRVLLAKAMLGLKDDSAAALMRDEAWKEYVSAPRFQRRKERLWAWRARPSRPATYLLIFVLVFGLFVTVVAPKLSQWGRTHRQSDTYSDPGLDEE